MEINNYSEFEFKAIDGLKIFGCAWLPSKNMKAIICLIHGLGEHSGRYSDLGAVFMENDYALFAMDQRGHGRSEGKRGHAQSYQVWLDDIKAFLAVVRDRYPQKDIILYGHSLGGNQVLNYILREEADIAGAIVTSPLLRLSVKVPIWKLVLAKIVNVVFPSFVLRTDLKSKDLSHLKEIQVAYEEDKLVHDRLSARAFLSFCEAGLWAISNANRLKVPLLLMHGSEDKITSCEASGEFADKAGDICSFKVWDVYFHELHNDEGNEAVMQYLLSWLAQHTNT
jgi:alpha-beta hydrolase superfamily lysophospholipase